uniref:ZMYM2-like/QRICH1 C-terminal domain-containing protein n=1 Tax=Arion vulgaris TaxID=1028688 RepID=A0A0B6Z902_9EUPU
MILKTLQPKVNNQGQMLCRIEEEHLWESKQLGAHSPFILLNTLIYFHTKHFILKTAQEHMALSFAQILKHWKKGMPLKGQSAASGKNVSLRFYCLANGKKDGLAARKNKDGLPVYEVTENFDNPLRCPVKLYEFFLSKCPESIKNRNDIFYPVPERSCVPDSPVWYSTQSIDIHTMDKMLTRLLLVREIQEAHLHAQPIYL